MITERADRPVEIVGVTTLGEVSLEPLTQIGGTGGVIAGLADEALVPGGGVRPGRGRSGRRRT
jgi:hypothetical protein